MAHVSKVANHTIILTRPTGKTDPKGNPIYQRVSPPIGQVFQFTQEEHDDLMRLNPSALSHPLAPQQTFAAPSSYTSPVPVTTVSAEPEVVGSRSTPAVVDEPVAPSTKPKTKKAPAAAVDDDDEDGL